MSPGTACQTSRYFDSNFKSRCELPRKPRDLRGVISSKTFRTLDNAEQHRISLLQALISIELNGAGMNEYILSTATADNPIAFGVVLHMRQTRLLSDYLSGNGLGHDRPSEYQDCSNCTFYSSPPMHASIESCLDSE